MIQDQQKNRHLIQVKDDISDELGTIVFNMDVIVLMVDTDCNIYTLFLPFKFWK